jgi:DNA-directed RNA polymerase specialized sigma24 family protein
VEQLAASSSASASETLPLRRAIAELAPQYSEPLLLQVLSGYHGDEIAESTKNPSLFLGDFKPFHFARCGRILI